MNSPYLRRRMAIFLFLVISATQFLCSAASGDGARGNTGIELPPLYDLSTFTHYQRFSDQPLLPWREANDAVEKIGGWRFYAREATLPAAADNSNGLKTDMPPEQPAVPSMNVDSYPVLEDKQ